MGRASDRTNWWPHGLGEALPWLWGPGQKLNILASSSLNLRLEVRWWCSWRSGKDQKGTHEGLSGILCLDPDRLHGCVQFVIFHRAIHLGRAPFLLDKKEKREINPCNVKTTVDWYVYSMEKDRHQIIIIKLQWLILISGKVNQGKYY